MIIVIHSSKCNMCFLILSTRLGAAYHCSFFFRQMTNLTYIVLGNPITKKNHQQIFRGKNGRPFITPSKQYKDFEKLFKSQIEAPESPISVPVEVTCLYYLQKRVRGDLTNYLEATDDCLVASGVLEDDNYKIIVSHDGSRVLYDKDNPRTEISIRFLA